MKWRIGILSTGIVLVLAVIWLGTGFQLKTAARIKTDNWVGSKLVEHAKLVGKDKCLGWVDRKEVNSNDDTKATFIGWAWDSGKSTPPQAVLLVNVNQTISGIAQLDMQRPDIRKAVSALTSDKVGWKGIAASADQITAYALLSSGEACPLGRTQ